MTFRQDDDDTSPGRITQGGHSPRRGNAKWLALLGAFIAIVAALFVVFGGPHKQAPAEEGTTPVSGSASTSGAGQGGAAAPVR